ncbi:MAG TPA: SAM-dependent methyltransferase [Cyclobacteriaceae bacterium]|nr:SAM-dependent methyltransferase [Cyclobacteriaceae bacterium]
MKGKLYLIPLPIAEDTQFAVIPQQTLEAIQSTTHFLCENIRTARRYISSLKIHNSIEELHFDVLDKDTKKEFLPELFRPLLNGKNLGVMSESGCPGVADPGALAVEYAHKNKIQVTPLVGPSSIILALMASGLNGQKFAFHGYLPVDNAAIIKMIRLLEQESRQENQTQIFIETPYRNNSLLAHLIKNLSPETRLCVCYNLTGQDEKIVSQPVSVWKNAKVQFEKAPAIFLFLASL